MAGFSFLGTYPARDPPRFDLSLFPTSPSHAAVLPQPSDRLADLPDRIIHLFGRREPSQTQP